MKKYLRPSLLCLSFAAAPTLPAADYFWDANGGTAGTGGTGTWGAVNTWRDGSATGTLLSWADGNAAVFGGTAGLTTAAAPVSPTELRFSVSNHNVIGAGPVNFGAGGAINWTGSTSGIELTAPLAGAVTISPIAGTMSGATSAFIKADSTGLTSVTLSGNDPNRNVIIDHNGAFGPAGTTVTITNAALGLGALTTESIGLASTAANGTGGGLNFPAWNLQLSGAIRSRAGANTINATTTLTGNSTLLTRSAAGVKLTFSPTATIDLGANTLTLHPGTNSDGIELSGAITGAGGITQAPSTLSNTGSANSTSTLAGVNTYTGPTAINSGNLRLTGSLTSDVTLASGSNLSGEGSTTGSLTFNGTHTLSFDPATSQALTAASVNAAAATITLTPSGTTPGTGLVVIDAPGGITGTAGANFIFTGRGSTYLNNDSTKLLFDYTPANLKWTGGDAGNPSGWDTNLTANWLNGAAPDKFVTADSVIFDETASVFSVTVQGTDVQPGAVLISGPVDYTIGGAPIAGTTALTKSGEATATLSASNTYTGGTTVSAGVLQLGDGTSAAGSAGTGPIVNNAALLLNHGAATTFANPVSGTGSFNKTGTGTVSVTGDVACAGGVTVSAGTLQIGNNTLTGTLAGNIVNNSTISFYRQDATVVSNDISGSGGLSKSQGAIVTLSGNNSFSGPVSVTGSGVSLAAGSASALGDTTGTTTIGAGARLVLADGVNIAGEPLTIAGGAANFNGALQAAAGAVATWGGAITLGSADARIGTEAGGTLTITGPVQNGTGASLHIGAGVGGVGTVVLATPAGLNSYTGNTNIVRGTVKLGAQDTLPAGTILDVDFSTAVEACVLDLNGFHQSAAGLQRSGAAAGGNSTVTNSSATAAVLTLNQNISTAYSGSVSGNLGLVKDGTGQLDLTGAISYTGSTRIKAGTLGFAQTGLSDTAAFIIDAGGIAALNFTGEDRVGSLSINGTVLPDGLYSATSHGGLYAAYLTGSGALRVGAAGYTAWIAGYTSLTGNDALPEADPEGDGIANMLEFVLGGDPTLSSSGILPVPASNGNALSLAFKRSDESEGDTTLTLQVSTDLTTWPAAAEVIIGTVSDTSGTLPGGVTYTVTENDGAPDDIIVIIPNGTEVRQYSRIKATR